MSGVFDDISVSMYFWATCIFPDFIISFRLNTVVDCIYGNINVLYLFLIFVSNYLSHYRYRLQFFVEYVPFNLCLEWGSGCNLSGFTILRIVMQVIRNPIISLFFITKTLNWIEFFCFVEIFVFIRKIRLVVFKLISIL